MALSSYYNGVLLGSGSDLWDDASNGYAWTTLTASSCSSNAISYYGQSQVAATPVPAAPIVEGEIEWLRKRVDEMCWREH